MDKYWYRFIGSDYTNSNHYSIILSNPVSSCAGGNTICAIYTQANALLPVRPLSFNSSFIDDMNFAMSSESYYPPAPDKPYIYTHAIL